MTWLGAPLFFLAQNFFVVHVRSFCSNKKLLRKCLWHTNYSTSLITSDVFAKHNFLLLARPYGVSDCTQRHFRMLLTPNYEMQPSVVLFWLHDVRIPWNFNISKSYFSFNMSKMDQFQRNLFNVRNNANAFFASVAESSSRLFCLLFNVFSVIPSCCISINLERNSYLFHTFFRLLWTFFIVGGFDSYKKTFITCAVGCLNEWFDASVRL